MAAAGVAGRGCAEDLGEVACQVRLVIKTGPGCRLAGWIPVEQQSAGSVDPAAGQVLMRADPELSAEGPDQVGWVDVQGIGRIPQADVAARPLCGTCGGSSVTT